MKKILIIEDTKEEYQKFKKMFLDNIFVDCDNEISTIYDVAKRNFKEGLNYDYVFIHNSFYQPNVSTEIVFELKNYVNQNFPYRLITYSGGTALSHNIFNLEQFTFYIHRKLFENNITSFVEFSSKIGKWYLPALFYVDYKNRFLKESYFKLMKNNDINLIQKCLEIIGYSEVIINENNRESIMIKIKEKADE